MITHGNLIRSLDPTPGDQRTPDYYQSLSRQYSAELEGMIRGLPLPKPRAIDWDALGTDMATYHAFLARREFSPVFGYVPPQRWGT